MSSIFCPPDIELTALEKEMKAKVSRIMYEKNKYDGLTDIPVLDSFLNNASEQLGGAAEQFLTVGVGALDAGTESLLASKVSALLGGLAVALSAGSYAQLALFAFLAQEFKKELLHRQFLYNKALFYLKARRTILLRYRTSSDKKNLRKIIAAQKEVARALKSFKTVERNLAIPPQRFSTAIHKNGIRAVEAAISILLGQARGAYQGTRVSINALVATANNLFDNMRTDVLSKLNDIKNLIWYVYQVLTCVMGNISVFSSQVSVALESFGSTNPAPEYQETPPELSTTRGMVMLNPSIKMWISNLSSFSFWVEDIAFLAKRLQSTYTPFVKQTSQINDEMLATIQSTTEENAALLLLNAKWTMQLAGLRSYTVMMPTAQQQDQLALNMQYAQEILDYLAEYKDTTSIRVMWLVLRAIGFRGKGSTTEAPKVDMFALGNFILTLTGGYTISSGAELDEALISTNEAIRYLGRAKSADNDLITQLGKINLEDNPLFNFIKGLSDAPAPLNAIGNMLGSGNLEGFAAALSAITTAVGTANELTALLQGCKNSGDSQAATKMKETAADNKGI